MKQTLIVYVQDEPGVLNRVSSMIRKRNFNIDSLYIGTLMSGMTGNEGQPFVFEPWG